MTLKTKTLLTGVVALLTAGALHAQDVTNVINIQNFDFSITNAPPADVASWTEYDNARTTILAGGPDGNGYCEMFGRFSGWDTRGLAQDILGTNWVRGTYTFSFAYARTETAAKYIRTRLYYGTGAGTLPAARVVFDQQVDVSSATIPQNTWFTNTVTFVVPDGHPAIGQPLGIRISPDDAGAAAGTGKVGVDLVRLQEVRPLGDVDYPQENMVYFVGEQVFNVPSVVGTPTSWSINPQIDFNTSLFFSTVDGSIGGFPTMAQALSNYVVTVSFAEGFSTNVQLSLVIKNPGLAGYAPSNVTVTVSTALAQMDPILEGTGLAYPTNYTVTPPLPAGIALDPFLGSITGVAPASASSNLYTVIAEYDTYPDSSTDIIIVVAPPILARYADGDFKQGLGQPMRPVSPTLTGVDVPTGFAVAPPLPTGIALDPVTGILSGINTAVQAPSTHTITASWASYPDSSVDITIEVFAGFADDFNGGIGALGDDSLWINVIPADFTFNQQSRASAPSGNSGFTGPTTVYLGTNHPAGGDFELSVNMVTAVNGLGQGLVFGYQNETNFWMCRVANGASAQGSGNDFILRCLKDGVQALSLGLDVGPDIPSGENLTLTVRYDDGSQMLAFEILDGSNNVYYAGTHAIQAEELPIAEGSLFGLQSWTASGTLFNNFRGSFAEQMLAPLTITDIDYDPATGEAVITWPGSAAKSYNLLGGGDVSSLGVLQSGIPGMAGDMSVTNTQPVGTPAQFYQVEQY